MSSTDRRVAGSVGRPRAPAPSTVGDGLTVGPTDGDTLVVGAVKYQHQPVGRDVLRQRVNEAALGSLSYRDADEHRFGRNTVTHEKEHIVPGWEQVWIVRNADGYRVAGS